MKGYFRKRDNGKWSFTIDVGKDPVTGKRRQKNRSGFKTKKEAQAACAELIHEVETGEYVKPEQMLVSDFMEKFIKSQIEPNFRTSTVDGYRKTLRLVIKKHWPYVLIGEVKPLHIQDLYDELLKTHQPGSIKGIHSHLKRMFSAAKELKVIKNNPAVVKPPSSKRTNSKEQHWSTEECIRFLALMKDDIYYLVYKLAIFTGMRRGEILGLPIKNVDYERNVITVDQQLITLDGEVRLTEELKSKGAYREIPVPADIMNHLKQYIHERRKAMLQLGIENKHGLVFHTSKGKWVHPNALNKMFAIAIERHNMKKISFHGLRHSHATMLAEMKENVHAISDRLGHSSTTITNEMYIHLTDKMRNDLSDKLNTMYEEKFKM